MVVTNSFYGKNDNVYNISVGFADYPWSSSHHYFPDTTLRYSDIHGVLVRAIILENPWEEDKYIFWTIFNINDAYYHISFVDYKELGKIRMHEIVSAMILSAPHDFSILESIIEYQCEVGDDL